MKTMKCNGVLYINMTDPEKRIILANIMKSTFSTFFFIQSGIQCAQMCKIILLKLLATNRWEIETEVLHGGFTEMSSPPSHVIFMLRKMCQPGIFDHMSLNSPCSYCLISTFQSSYLLCTAEAFLIIIVKYYIHVYIIIR